MTEAKPSSQTQPGRVEAARAAIGDTAAAARETMEQSYRAARDKASKAYAGAIEGAEHAVDATRRTARTAARKTTSTVDTAPLAVLVGGLAVGAIAGSLLPRTQRETQAFGSVGRKVTGTAAAAARAAKAAGQEQLNAVGINRDAAKSQLSTLVDGVIKALGEAGNAATAEVKAAPKR